MTDIHSHILFNVDDGSKSIEESILLLRELSNIGFNNLILTPHYIDNSSYNIPNNIKLEKLKILKEEIKKHNININIYLGNEIFIHNNIIESFNKNLCYPYNNSKYFLLELPFHDKIDNLLEYINEIKNNGYIPIIAHPERYTYFQKNYTLVDKLKENNVLFQCNYTSILGYYRKDAEELVRYMYKNKYVDYLGTDLHRINSTFVIDNFDKIIKEIKNITGEEYFNTIMNNCDSLIMEKEKE